MGSGGSERAVIDVYIDESGRPDLVGRNAKRRQRLFVLSAIAVGENGSARIGGDHERLLRTPIRGVGGDFTLEEVFELYERVVGSRGEIKAGWIIHGEGAFSILRGAPPQLRTRILLNIFNKIFDMLEKHALRIYIVVVDKVLAAEMAERIERATGLSFNLRVFALDFLLTRIARLIAKGHIGGAVLIHDSVSEHRLVRDYFSVALQRGFIYNPRLRLSPEAYRRISLEFRDSKQEPLIQYADIVAYAARSLRSGTTGRLEAEAYRRRLYVNTGSRGSLVEWIEYLPSQRSKGLR